MSEHDEWQHWNSLQERLDDPFRMCGGFMTKKWVYMDIPRKGAASMYRSNFEGVPRALEVKLPLQAGYLRQALGRLPSGDWDREEELFGRHQQAREALGRMYTFEGHRAPPDVQLNSF